MNTIFIAGHARLPSGMAAQNMYETLTITAEIDKNYGVIVTSSCTLATIHGQGFVEQMLKGYSLQDGIDRKSTRLNSSHVAISYAVFCLKKKTEQTPDIEHSTY